MSEDLGRVAATLRTAGQAIGHQEFAERLLTAVRDGLAELDALPRSDEFWSGWANDRATVGKLAEYARTRLEDREARRVLIALALARGANDGGLTYLAAEIAVDAAAVADAVIAARWIRSEVGLDTTGQLRQALSGVDLAALRRLAADDRLGWTCEAARIGLDVLTGGTVTGPSMGGPLPG